MAKQYWKESRMLDGVRVRRGAEIKTAADVRLAAVHPDAVTTTFPRTKPAEEPKAPPDPKGAGGKTTEGGKS